jgi:hypothetical protein
LMKNKKLYYLVSKIKRALGPSLAIYEPF